MTPHTAVTATRARRAGTGTIQQRFVAATRWRECRRLDTLGRPLRDLRISVTDRCNFRCIYCMPKEVFGRDYVFLDRRELLTFEEIARAARAGSSHSACTSSGSPAASRSSGATSSA